MTKKIELIIFLPKNLFATHFGSKHLENTLGILLNQSMTSKNTKNTSRPEINSKQKNFPSLDLFLGTFKIEKTLNSNSFHYRII